MLLTERGGCVGDHTQSRLRLGEEIIELSDDDEIPMASDNVGDEKTPTEGGEEGSKGSGGGERNNEDDSVWPRSGLQAQSYYHKLSVWKKLIRGMRQIFQSAKVFGK